MAEQGGRENTTQVVNDVKPWERAWMTSEMKQHAADWNLAGDAGMLQYLQSFSQDLLAQTHNIQEQLNQVNREAKLTGVRMNNIFNDFIMLANNQFVENRVYDEDVSVEETTTNTQSDTQEKTQEQREAELIPKINEAITLGLSVIDTGFEKRDVNEANSFNEEENVQHRDVLLAPKDPYIGRPLPYLIGSLHFMHADNLGLAEESDEEPEPEIKESSSESGSESEGVRTPHEDKLPRQPTKWSQSESESEGELFADKKSKSSADEDDLFNDDKSQPDDDDKSLPGDDDRSQSDEEIKEKAPQRPVGGFLDELSGKLGVKPTDKVQNTPQKSDDNKQTVSKREKKHLKKPKKEAADDDIFSQVRREAAADESEEDDDIFKPKAGRFSGHGGLFDDDEGDLFADLGASKPSDSKPAAKTKPVKKEPTLGSHAFDRQPPPLTDDLFGGDDDESDDDIFASKVSSKSSSSRPTSSKSASSSSRSAGLFADETESVDDLPPAKPSQPQKKLPAGAVSMFGAGGNPLLQAVKQHQAPASDESLSESDTESDRHSGSYHDTDTSSSGPVDITTAVTKLPPGGQRKKHAIQVLPTPTDSAPSGFGQPTPKPVGQKAAAPIGGLFDDDKEDLFASVRAKPKDKTSKPVTKPTDKPTADLFTNDDDEEEDLFSSMAKSKTAKPQAKTQERKAPTKQVLSLFDDEDEPEDIFSSLQTLSSSDQKNKQEQKETKKKKVPTATLR